MNLSKFIWFNDRPLGNLSNHWIHSRDRYISWCYALKYLIDVKVSVFPKCFYWIVRSYKRVIHFWSQQDLYLKMWKWSTIYRPDSSPTYLLITPSWFFAPSFGHREITLISNISIPYILSEVDLIVQLMCLVNNFHDQ